MKRGHVLALIALSGMVPSITLADGLYERAGWTATIPTGAHSVQAVVTIVDERTLFIEHFTYDGTATGRLLLPRRKEHQLVIRERTRSAAAARPRPTVTNP